MRCKRKCAPRLFVMGSRADRDFMQILISLTKAEKKNYIMDTLFVASTYRAQSVTGWRSFRVCFFFLFHRPLHALPFSNHLSPTLPSWQLVGHIWPVISKMSNKIMHRTSVTSPPISRNQSCVGLHAHFAPLFSVLSSFFSYHDCAPRRRSIGPVLSSIRFSSISLD